MPPLFALIFLDPSAALIAGSLGGAGLLVFYFLRLRRRPVRISSTLLWLKTTADLQVNVPFRWLRPSWLLLLQLIVLACLSMALGRPASTDAEGQSASIILLVDQSASMSARVGGAQDQPSRLDHAKERAKEVLTALPSEVRALLVGFAAQPTAVTGFSRDRGLLRQAIDGLPPTDEPADLDRAFELVRAMAAQSGEGAAQAPPRVVLITDGGFDAGIGAGGVGRANLDVISVGSDAPEPPDNAGIVALSARRDYGDPSMVRLFTRVQSVTGRELSLPVEVRLDGETIEGTALTIPMGSVDSPADAARTFEFQNTSGGLVTLSLGRTDELESDNSAALVLRTPASLRVLLVRPNIAVDAVDEVVRAAIESLNPGSLRVMNAAEFERTSGDHGADLIILDRVRPVALPSSPTISFGATLPIPGLGVAEPAENEPVAPTGFVFWVRSHPLMRYVVLNEVWIARPLRVTLPAQGTEAGSTRVDALASGSSGPLIVLAEQGDMRRIVVGFDVGQSNWVKEASFHIFLKNAVDYLTLSGEEEAGRGLRTTETFSVRPAPGTKAIDVTGPVEFSREAPPAGERAVLGPFPRVGVYEIGGVLAEDSLVAVNLLNPTESRLAVSSSIQLASGTVSATTQAAAPKELWHWFVLGALAALCVEWLIYAWRMRV